MTEDDKNKVQKLFIEFLDGDVGALGDQTQIIREVFRTMFQIADEEYTAKDIGELFSTDLRIPPMVLAQLIKNNVQPKATRKNDRDQWFEKPYWLDVAEHMSGGYDQGLFHASVFVTKMV